MKMAGIRTRYISILLLIIILTFLISAESPKTAKSTQEAKGDEKLKLSDNQSIEVNQKDGNGGLISNEHVLNSLLADLRVDDEGKWPPFNVHIDGPVTAWPGHLKPWGSTGRTMKLALHVGLPEPKHFFNEYNLPLLPVLMGNAINDSWAYKNWRNDKYFLQFPHIYTTWIDGLYKNRKNGSERFSFIKFLEKYKETNLHFVQHVPSFLQSDFPMPTIIKCNHTLRHLTDHELIFSSGEYHGSIKSQNEDNLICTVSGQLQLVLTPWFSAVPQENYTEIDVREVDYTKFPSVKNVEFYVVVIGAGNCLFVPNKWFYQMNAVDRVLTVRIGWNHTKSPVNNHSCTEAQMSLYSANFSKINREDHMKNYLLHYFSNYLLNQNKSELNFTVFKQILKKDNSLLINMTKWTDELSEITKELFKVLDMNKDDVFSRADLHQLTPESVEGIRGLLEDRIADYDDVMKDQQEEKKENEENEAKAKEYMEAYVKSLETVMAETLDEVKKDPQAIQREVQKAQEKSRSTIQNKFKSAGDDYQMGLQEMMGQLKELIKTKDEAAKLMQELDDIEKKADKNIAKEKSKKKIKGQEKKKIKKEEL